MHAEYVETCREMQKSIEICTSKRILSGGINFASLCRGIYIPVFEGIYFTPFYPGY
jgi:hypothetical protein